MCYLFIKARVWTLKTGGVYAMGEILVVDDDPEVLRATGYALKAGGYESILTHSPEEALGLLKENPNRFDAILLDWKLRCPIDGDMVVKLVKRIFPGFITPIIFVTAHTKIASSYLMRLGAFEILPKPLESQELIDAVERALNKKPPEDPHLKAPCEINSQELRKQELARRIIDAITATQTLTAAAHELRCSRVSLYKWLRITGLHQFLTVKEL